MTCFGDAEQYRVALRPALRSVETVINHRVIDGRHIIAGVSGGVHVSPWLRSAARRSKSIPTALHAEQRHAKSDALPMTPGGGTKRRAAKSSARAFALASEQIGGALERRWAVEPLFQAIELTFRTSVSPPDRIRSARAADCS